jgi:hypothetical protein
VTVAKLLARDGTILEDAIPFEVGTATVAGKLVLSSLNLISGGGVSMPSLTIG